MNKRLSVVVLLMLSGPLHAQSAPTAATAMDIWAPPGGALIDMGKGEVRVPADTGADNDPFSSVVDKIKQLSSETKANPSAARRPLPSAAAAEAVKDATPPSGAGSPLVDAVKAAQPAVAPAGDAPDKADNGRPAIEAAPPATKKPPKKHSRVAEKNVLQEPLPGVSHMRGAKGLPAPVEAPTPLVFDITNGVTEVVTISKSMPNRIATPFSKPIAVDSSGAEIEYVGNNVYILPADDEPFGVFISDESGGPVASLTFVPQRLPSQNVILQVDRSRAIDAIPGAKSARRGRPDSHTDKLVHMLRSLVADQSPPGFTLAKLDVGKVRVGAARLTPDRRWTGPHVDVYRYVVRNTSTAPVELTESSFYEEGVKAVAFFPSIRLSPNETTFAFVVTEGRRPNGTVKGMGPGSMRKARRR